MGKDVVNIKRQRAWQAVVSSIRRTYPFKNKGEFAAFNAFAVDFKRHLPASDKDDAEFFLFLENFFARFGNSHTKLNKYPTKAFYKPAGCEVKLIGGRFHLMRYGTYMGELILVDGRSPKALLSYRYTRTAGTTRRFRLYQALKLVLV